MAHSRRSFLAVSGGLGAAALVADWSRVEAALAEAALAATQSPPPPLTTLTAAQALTIEAMAERILPATETPGAKGLGVIHFIDRALGGFEKKSLPLVRRGIADLARRAARRKGRGASFAALAAEEQDAILAEIEQEEFFGAVRYLTMVGAFANPSHGGNRDRAGWAMIGFDPRSSHTSPFGYYDAPQARAP